MSNGAFCQRAEAFFDEADTDNTGSLTKLELAKVVQKCGIQMDHKAIVGLFDDLDRNDDDAISREEFVSALGKIPPEKVVEADLDACFKRYDSDGTGFLSREEIEQVMQEAGYECKDVLDGVDDNGDGKVSLHEFKDLFKQSATK